MGSLHSSHGPLSLCFIYRNYNANTKTMKIIVCKLHVGAMLFQAHVVTSFDSGTNQCLSSFNNCSMIGQYYIYCMCSHSHHTWIKHGPNKVEQTFTSNEQGANDWMSIWYQNTLLRSYNLQLICYINPNIMLHVACHCYQSMVTRYKCIVYSLERVK